MSLPPWLDFRRALPISPSPLPNSVDLLGDVTWSAGEALLARAEAGMSRLAAEGLAGCWWGAAAPDGNFEALMVIGADDDPTEVAEMVESVIDHQPTTALLLVLVAAPAKAATEHRGALELLRARGAVVLLGDHAPQGLLAAAARVHVVADMLGFMALMAGRQVTCHGGPFYAGWGLTDDRIPRRGNRSLAEVFAAEVLLATAYADPYDGTPTGFEAFLEVAALARRLDRDNRKVAAFMGMAFWKRARIAEFFCCGGPPAPFLGSTGRAVSVAAARGGGIAVWASREPADLARKARAQGVPVIRVEDGFIRSAGLGADFIPPASITLDSDGLYFDPTRPSGLEHILDTIELDPAELARSRHLIALLVERSVTKYGAGGPPFCDLPEGRRTILVPGQVEDDRSVVLGGAGIYSNIDLLRRVRADNPDAFIVYKPHPDVDAGHRPGAVSDAEALRLADRLVRGGAMAQQISAVAELHCLTSLAGFEALLRNKKVTTYGHPFYAGWGLTDDRNPPPRRGRRLSLEQLVAGTLLRYARYIDPLTGLPCGPETVIARLADPAANRLSALVWFRRWQGRLTRPFRRLFRPRPEPTIPSDL
ncbi:MAG: hypothetical protein WC493_09395 [Zavarzinia sp.]